METSIDRSSSIKELRSKIPKINIKKLNERAAKNSPLKAKSKQRFHFHFEPQVKALTKIEDLSSEFTASEISTNTETNLIDGGDTSHVKESVKKFDSISFVKKSQTNKLSEIFLFCQF